MKKAILISMALLMSLVVTAQEKKQKTVDITFETSITCDNCVNTIMSSLPLEKGVKDVKCSLETKEVKVSYRSDKTDKETIKRALEKLGYVAKEVEKKDKEKKIAK